MPWMEVRTERYTIRGSAGACLRWQVDLSFASLDLRSLGALLLEQCTPLTTPPPYLPLNMPTRRSLLPVPVLICKKLLCVAAGRSSMTHGFE